ncbi:hypothetical protein B2G71_09545 [Novosphingobium sp. PC22D]|uniref:diguanylate cyclase domain-containing protein n=1 Tax=Novosphingobium sp. PC22D TaxID=1962403 RepID=UPI000BF04532|nr:diguanylate cyclase [Novosphingobium sp. PC22D]PEQ13055.1 hypothetical protein B2G71_09545 [Novosphingobium sp. PC22D]
MLLNFTLEESCVLYGLMAENSSDVILKIDCDGFILHASPAFERLGYKLPSMLIGPHVADLAQAGHAPVVRGMIDAVLGGRASAEQVEIALETPAAGARRFAMQMRVLTDEGGAVYGALVVLRSVEELRALEEELFVVSMTDPLTGLTNRKAFVSMLQHLLDADRGGCLGLFAIDHLRAINMKHGIAVGDKVLCAFADHLRTLMPDDAIVSRIGSETFAALLPAMSAGDGEQACRDVVDTLAEVASTGGGDGVKLTASAGLGSIAGGIDRALWRAELALFKARARGPSGFEADIDGHPVKLRLRA